MCVPLRWAILLVLALQIGCAPRERAAPRSARAPIPAPTPKPAGPPADFDLGQKAFQEGRFDEAVRRLLAAEPAMPGSNALYHFLGASYVKLGQTDAGIAALIRANSYKEDASTYDWLGLAYRDKGDFAESARCYQKALAMAPGNVTFYYGLGVASYWMGWIPEALQAIQMGLQKGSPQDRPGLFELEAWVYGARGMYPEVFGLLGNRPQIGAIVRSHAEGLEVVRQMRGFPADAAGLRPGDVLTAFNGTSLKGTAAAGFQEQILARAEFGSKAAVRFLRSGQEYQTEVVVGVPAQFAALAKSAAGPRPLGAAQGPSLKLVRLEVKPATVSPGARFDLEADYIAAGAPPDANRPGVEFTFSILEGGQVRYSEPPLSLGPPGGARQTRLQHLTATTKPGAYTIRVTLRYRGLTAEDSVNFTIR